MYLDIAILALFTLVYSSIAGSVGCKDWFTARVTTVGESGG
jgi:hypothetical protein